MRNTVSATKHPNIVALFTNVYKVTLPEMYLRLEEDIRARGTFTTGDPDRDQSHQNSTATAYRTINQLFELWRMGVTPGIVRYEDTEKIYYAIEKHLSCWYKYLAMSVGISNCPFDELLDLDRFANVVYDKAKYVFTEESLVPIQNTVKDLGFSLNPMDFQFKSSKNRIRFNHSFKTDQEILAEQGLRGAEVFSRRSYEEDITKIASRFDVRLNNPRLEAAKPEVKPLTTELFFGNSR